MSRDDGFVVADVSTALPADPKFNALWRRLHDKGAMCEARTIYEDVRLASWAAGERIAVADAMSLWLDPDPAILAAMVVVGLLDDDHRIPEQAWVSWFGAAWDRREARRYIGRKGGQASGKKRGSEGEYRPTIEEAEQAFTLAEPTVNRQSPDAEPDRSDRTGPSSPCFPTEPSAAAAGGGSKEPAMKRNGVDPEQLASALKEMTPRERAMYDALRHPPETTP